MGYGIDELETFFEEDENDEYIVHPIWESQAKARYENNKKINIGDNINCASCNKSVKKKSYQSQFCSNKGRSNCKDYFWNRIDRKRFERALDINKNANGENI